jgi:hypothetical protein
MKRWVARQVHRFVWLHRLADDIWDLDTFVASQVIREDPDKLGYWVEHR